MDKETLSNYGWIVICTLVLAVMIALAGPFGNFIAGAIQSTTQGLFDVNQNALDSAGIQIMEQEFENMLSGNNGAVVPDGFTYTDAITGEVLGSGQAIPSLSANDTLTEISGDYIYTLMQDGFATLEEARAYYKVWFANQSGIPWSDLIGFVESTGGTEEDFWADCINTIGVGLTADTFVANSNPSHYWSVAVKDRTQSSYGQIESRLLDFAVTDMTGAFQWCTNLTVAPSIPDSITNLDAAFFGCTALADVSKIVVPKGVLNMRETFDGCTVLSGTIIVDVENLSMYSDCFEDTNNSIILVGNGSNNDVLALLVGTANNGNVTVQ